MKFMESFQSQKPNLKNKKLSLELINHIVKKNIKILKLNLNNHSTNEKNVLFEYFKSNKYQENYLRAKLSNQKSLKNPDIGLPEKNDNLFVSTQTLSILKRIKSKNNSQTEQSLEKEKESERKSTEGNKTQTQEKRPFMNANTINPYQLSKQDLINEYDQERDSFTTPTSNTNVLFGVGTPLVSSKHNMFRVRPKNIYIMKNYYLKCDK